MKPQLFFAAFFVCLPVIGEGLDLSRIPEDAKWIAYFDQSQTLSSSVGPALKERISEKAEKLESLKKIIGLHLANDIKSWTLFGPDADPAEAVLYIQGAFDREKLEGVTPLLPDYQAIKTNRGVIHSWTEKKKKTPLFAAFASETLIIIGQKQARVELCLDVCKKSLRSAADSGAFKAVVADNPRALAVFAVRELDSFKKVDPQSPLAKNVKAMALVVSEKSGKIETTLSVEATTTDSAELIRDSLTGVRAFAILNESKRPNGALIARNATVKQSGSTVSLNATLTIDEIKKIVKEAKKPDTEEMDAARRLFELRQRAETK